MNLKMLLTEICTKFELISDINVNGEVIYF